MYLCKQTKHFTNMKIGVIVAMDKEYNDLQKIAKSFENKEIILIKCGIGTVNAALGAQKLIFEHHPDVIISTGCAGGNGDDINIQDVIVSTELCYHDVYCGRAIDDTTKYGQVQGMPERFAADPKLLEVVDKMPVKTHKGLIVTGDWFVDTREKMQSIIELFPEAKAVDMESCAIAQACYINKVPFISFRIISDIPLRDTDASQYHNFWSNVANRSFEATRTFLENL